MEVLYCNVCNILLYLVMFSKYHLWTKVHERHSDCNKPVRPLSGALLWLFIRVFECSDILVICAQGNIWSISKRSVSQFALCVLLMVYLVCDHQPFHRWCISKDYSNQNDDLISDKCLELLPQKNNTFITDEITERMNVYCHKTCLDPSCLDLMTSFSMMSSM